MKRDYVDFHEVPAHQLAIHARLENWGRWCHGSGHAQMAPMFRMYRSSEVYQAIGGGGAPVDIPDAARIAKAVIALPEQYRHAMAWCYVNKTSVSAACRRIACTAQELAALVIDGRQMMLNRGA